jgi:hypothetical protein
MFVLFLRVSVFETLSGATVTGPALICFFFLQLVVSLHLCLKFAFFL